MLGNISALLRLKIRRVWRQWDCSSRRKTKTEISKPDVWISIFVDKRVCIGLIWHLTFNICRQLCSQSPLFLSMLVFFVPPQGFKKVLANISIDTQLPKLRYKTLNRWATLLHWSGEDRHAYRKAKFSSSFIVFVFSSSYYSHQRGSFWHVIPFCFKASEFVAPGACVQTKVKLIQTNAGKANSDKQMKSIFRPRLKREKKNQIKKRKAYWDIHSDSIRGIL